MTTGERVQAAYHWAFNERANGKVMTLRMCAAAVLFAVDSTDQAEQAQAAILGLVESWKIRVAANRKAGQQSSPGLARAVTIVSALMEIEDTQAVIR